MIEGGASGDPAWKLHSAAAMPVVLCDFRATRPRYEVAQQDSLLWLTAAHVQAEATRARLDGDAREHVAARIAAAFERCACSPEQIARRGAAIPDVGDTHWSEHVLYDLHDDPRGRGTHARTRLFDQIVTDYFAAAYAGDRDEPDDLVHVTCTGYVAPSGAQRLVARRGFRTRVTHAYHMGCYAAVPAVRMAAGFVACGSRRVDVVHTELCSLHLDPADHRLEQIVVQSLFADGFIRYAVRPEAEAGPGLALRGVVERVLPETANAMTWEVADHGMQMTLAPEVPARIARVVRDVVVELFGHAGEDPARIASARFAVHPGGPRIIDAVCRALELAPVQVRESRAVLHDCGNMSSATLPHVWQRIVDEPELPPGTLVPSLAFGPGLTVCAALFEKR